MAYVQTLMPSVSYDFVVTLGRCGLKTYRQESDGTVGKETITNALIKRNQHYEDITCHLG